MRSLFSANLPLSAHCNSAGVTVWHSLVDIGPDTAGTCVRIVPGVSGCNEWSSCRLRAFEWFELKCQQCDLRTSVHFLWKIMPPYARSGFFWHRRTVHLLKVSVIKQKLRTKNKGILKAAFLNFFFVTKDRAPVNYWSATHEMLPEPWCVRFWRRFGMT